MPNPTRLAVIACAVFESEVREFTQGKDNIRMIEFVSLGLHETPPLLQRELQQRVCAAEANPEVDAIVLVYGLCGKGVEDLRHERCPLVMPRAHDCVTLYLGSKETYAKYQAEHPGVYWYSPGWIRGLAMPGPDREKRLREKYAGKFDEEDVDYLLEMDREAMAQHDRAIYTGFDQADTAKDIEYTKTCAACMGWGFDRVPGDPRLLRALLEGDWDKQRFLVVPPHHVIRMTGDEDIVRAVPESAI